MKKSSRLRRSVLQASAYLLELGILWAIPIDRGRKLTADELRRTGDLLDKLDRLGITLNP